VHQQVKSTFAVLMRQSDMQQGAVNAVFIVANGIWYASRKKRTIKARASQQRSSPDQLSSFSPGTPLCKTKNINKRYRSY
jgi:hypothetical protein